jgi:hypothetical protein
MLIFIVKQQLFCWAAQSDRIPSKQFYEEVSGNTSPGLQRVKIGRGRAARMSENDFPDAIRG